MSTRRALARLNKRKLIEICTAQLGVLVLTRTSCGNCDVYQADIERLMDKGEFTGIPIGKLVADDPGAGRYMDVDALAIDLRQCPITLIYEQGQEIDRFSSSRASYLLTRIEVAAGFTRTD
jgi:hypothetical protein